MTQHDHTQFLKVLHCFLSPTTITFLAGAHGWFERKRKIDPVVFVWTLILGFCSGATRSRAGLGRAYERHSGCKLSPSGFYQRLDADLLATMTDLLKLCMRPYGRTMGAFEDILALDESTRRVQRANWQTTVHPSRRATHLRYLENNYAIPMVCVNAPSPYLRSSTIHAGLPLN